MRKTIVFAIAIIGACFYTQAMSHGGGLDANGCHTKSATGEYHCHNKNTVAQSSSLLKSINVSAERGNYIHNQADNPATSDDESNNQPLGFYGTETVKACTTHNGRCYTLDAKFNDRALLKVYFVKGGRLSFKDNQCALTQSCRVQGKNGREWVINRYETK